MLMGFFIFLVFDGMLIGLLMLLHTWFAFAAMHMVFLSFLVFDGMLMGFWMLFHTLLGPVFKRDEGEHQSTPPSGLIDP